MEINKVRTSYGSENVSYKSRFTKAKKLKALMSATAITAGIGAGSSLIKSLENMGDVNKVVLYKNYNPHGFRLNLSQEELEKRTNNDHLATKTLVNSDFEGYKNLKDGDKEALKHLVKAASVFNDVYMKLDNQNNIPFRDYLEHEIKTGNNNAKLTKILFDAQKGVSSLDRNVDMVNLAKGITQKPGKGIYPEDLSKEEFHSILIKMLNEGKKEEVANILNQRSIVERDGDELKAIPYTEKFKKEFTYAATELEKAAEVSTNSDFNEYLKLQIKALKEEDPMLDAYADKKWATLQDTPLEFTLVRENYEDEFTNTVMQNPELKELLDKNGIVAYPKDFLGVRVGIVNKEGTDSILKVKKYLPLMANNMPFKDKYVQNITPNKDSKQTMVDVDLVAMTGETGAYRAGITIAENLPNDDKLSVQVLDGGRRNVYHRQIRSSQTPDAKQTEKIKLNAILAPELHQYYNNEAFHKFTIGHENGHSLGPKSGTEALGKNRLIIEENKADMVSISMLDVLTDAGLYTPEERNQIIVSFAVNNIQSAKPTMSQAHRVRSVMQTHYFIENGAMEISKDGVLNVNIDKMVPTAKKMLEEIIQVQMSGDFSKGEKYVMDNFVWTNEMQALAENIKSVSTALNGKIESPLADKLLNE